MRLATRAAGTRDGALIVVSEDGTRWLHAGEVAATLQAALDDWQSVEPHLQTLARHLEAGEG